MRMLHSDRTLSKLAKALGLNTWEALVEFVEKLPYGRNSNRSDFSLVLKEKMGTCSSKHALLKSIAIENDFEEVEQILGIYKMNESNTPGVGTIFLSPQINYIPEAHSYLKINGQYFDYTNQEASYQRIANDVLHEQTINPEDVVERKVELHKSFIKNWISDLNLNLSLEEVWAARETCIKNLSNL